MEMKGMSFYDGGPGDGKGKKKKKKGKNSSQPVFMQSNDVKGSCEAGNLRAKKTKVCKTDPFNPKAKKLKGRTVGSAKQRAREEKRAARKNSKTSDVYGNPRFL